MRSPDDERFIRAAIRLSRRKEGLTAENPSVGCLIVRDGRIVGQGVTAPGGRPHAERIALSEAGEAARGATAYVTLEPCAHYGQTPPCAEALIAAGVARVVVAANDPDPRVNGRGYDMLRRAGVNVTTGVGEAEAARQLAPFLTRTVLRRPHVLLKLAVSTNGFLGSSERGNVPITGPISQRQVHLLRARSDAILVGSGTVLLDDPALTVRLPGLEGRSPKRFVIDRRGRIDRTARIFEGQGATVLGEGALQDHLRGMAESEISSLMVEGGARVAHAFIEADLVDELVLFTSDRSIAGDVPSPIVADELPSAFTIERRDHFGTDTCLTLRRNR